MPVLVITVTYVQCTNTFMTHTYMQCTNTYIHAMNTHIYARTRHVHAHTHTCTYTYIHAIHKHVYAHPCTYTYMHPHRYVWTYICDHICFCFNGFGHEYLSPERLTNIRLVAQLDVKQAQSKSDSIETADTILAGKYDYIHAHTHTYV